MAVLTPAHPMTSHGIVVGFNLIHCSRSAKNSRFSMKEIKVERNSGKIYQTVMLLKLVY